MTPERWRRVEEIVTAAADVDPAGRRAFVAEACRDDAELKAEVESLLTSLDAVAPGFLESPAIDAFPGLSPRTPRLASPSLARGTRLGPYEILELLGAGGMGEVYRARDTRLARDVAVKVLPRSFAQNPAALARFRREAQAIAALSHPNILVLHDLGEEGGVLFAVTELLQGRTLQERLAEGALPQRMAVEIALAVAHGLSAAHDKGIVHRDLKPANVFLADGGGVKILDFGLAKVTARDPASSGPPAEGPPTEPGIVMGTVGYMSPEQLRGLTVDQRSDIFSFGAILYEMLSGKRPFGRPTQSDTIAAILTQEPPELSKSVRDIPPLLDQIVRHCLEKDRERRFRSAYDVVDALSSVAGGARGVSRRPGGSRVLVAAALISILAVAGLLFLARSRRNSGDRLAGRRVAVLPFENLGPPEYEYFADGIADEVRGKLTSLPDLEVIARASSTPYRNTNKSPNQIAAELNVSYLLTATVRWEKSGGGSRVQVSPELVDVSHADAPTSKWQQSFDASLTDIFQVQSDIASRVAHALGVVLAAGDERRLSEMPTKNLAAYDAFLRGEEASSGMGVVDPPSIRKALGYYEEAVALDPNFAQAWASVSNADSMLYLSTTPTPDLAERARQAAEKAVALAPGRVEGYLALGRYHHRVTHDLHRALQEYAKGERLAPTNADLGVAIAVAEMAVGRWDAAVDRLRRGPRFDPRSVENERQLSHALLRLRRYAEARQESERGLALAPSNLILIQYKAMTFLGQGDLAGARAVLRDTPRDVEQSALVATTATFWDLGWALDEEQQDLLLRLTPAAFDGDRGLRALCFTQIYAWRGDTSRVRRYAEEARQALEEQLRVTPGDDRLHAYLGLSLAYLGRKEDAIQEGLRAVELLPVARDQRDGPYDQHQLARIYILVGEHARALDQIEPLMKIPYFLSPGWLEVDPNFTLLRQDPRFQKLVSGTP